MIESCVLSWNSKVANAILAQVQGTCLGYSRESIQHIEQISSVVCKEETRKKNHSSTRFLYGHWWPGTSGGILPPGSYYLHIREGIGVW